MNGYIGRGQALKKRSSDLHEFEYHICANGYLIDTIYSRDDLCNGPRLSRRTDQRTQMRNERFRERVKDGMYGDFWNGEE